MSRPVIWLYAPPRRRGQAEKLRAALAGRAAPLVLGPGGEPAPELSLGPAPDLALALETCPAELKPRACACLATRAPAGLDCLPCPVLGWRGGAGLEGDLPEQTAAAAEALLAAAGEAFAPPWLPRVQVNLPLGDMLGRYRPLVQALPLNLEVGLDAHALDQLGPGDLADARRLLQGRRVTAHLVFMDLAPGSRDPKLRELSRQRLLAAAGLAGELGAEQAVAHLGFDHRTNPEPTPWLERAAPVFAELAERLAGAGCRLVLENVFEPDPGLHLGLLERLARLTPAAVGLCLDTGHALAFSATDLEGWWRAFAPHLGEMHLHDNQGQADQHLPVGWGAVDWARLGRGLAGLEQRPVLTLEPHREPHLWASLRGLDRLWPHLAA